MDYKSVHKYLHRGQLPAVAESPPELVWQLLRSRERLTQTGVRESSSVLHASSERGADVWSKASRDSFIKDVNST